MAAVAFGALALAAGISGGAALVYFAMPGSGTGSGGVGELQPVAVLQATATPTTALIPGGSSNLSLLLDNPNGYAVTIVGISQDGPATVVGGSGCTAENSGVSVATQRGLQINLVSGSDVPIEVAGAAAMSVSSDSGCQGASFQIPVTVTVQK